jgi:hypothetical protein
VARAVFRGTEGVRLSIPINPGNRLAKAVRPLVPPFPPRLSAGRLNVSHLLSLPAWRRCVSLKFDLGRRFGAQVFPNWLFTPGTPGEEAEGP